MTANTSLLRLAWAAVEESSPCDLLNLSDAMLVRRLLQQVVRKILLSDEEVGTLCGYLNARIPLIRDMAESRLALEA